MNETTAGGLSLRLPAILLVTVEALTAAFYVVVFHQPGRSDAITNIVVDSITLVVAVIWLVFVLPAIILLARATRPGLALGLALCAVAAFAACVVIF